MAVAAGERLLQPSGALGLHGRPVLGRPEDERAVRGENGSQRGHDGLDVAVSNCQ